MIGWSRGPASARASRTSPKLWSGAPVPEVSEPRRLVVSLTLWSEAAALIMETGASREPETAEVLPQHKFDCRSLEAYLHQHLPGFGAEPEAKLTVAQYRYRRQPSPPAKTDLCLVFFFLWPWCVPSFPHPVSFSAMTHSEGESCRHPSLALHSEYFQFKGGDGSTITFTIPTTRRNLC